MQLWVGELARLLCLWVVLPLWSCFGVSEAAAEALLLTVKGEAGGVRDAGVLLLPGAGLAGSGFSRGSSTSC